MKGSSRQEIPVALLVLDSEDLDNSDYLFGAIKGFNHEPLGCACPRSIRCREGFAAGKALRRIFASAEVNSDVRLPEILRQLSPLSSKSESVQLLSLAEVDVPSSLSASWAPTVGFAFDQWERLRALPVAHS